MLLSRERILQTSLEPLRPYIREDDYFYKPPGVEHYRLLAHLSTLVSGRTIFDIGTYRGDSAIALSLNPANKVFSFDVEDRVPDVRKRRSNVVYFQQDLFDPSMRERWREVLLESAFIFIDVDPHEGKVEHELVSWLERYGYRGLIVLDDIWHFKGMRDELWSKIEPRFKVDATRLGHWSGAGLVSFIDPLPVVLENPLKEQQDRWTLVTGYFDLTERSDANPDIKQRPSKYYIEDHAGGLLGQDVNLVIFCDPKEGHVDKIWKMRPKHLHERTRIIEREFDGFPLSTYFTELVSKRGAACARHPRATASYYLFCMARFAMLRETMQFDFFESDRFAWINICIERYGARNLAFLPDALGAARELFSTCYIDQVHPRAFENLSAFFGKDGCRDPYGPCGRCSLCSGFFTGGRESMLAVCDLMEAKFLECMREGYGHADEQLLTLVHHVRPDLFDLYPGDYQDMITNYAVPRDHPEAILRNLIRNSLAHEDWATCARAARTVWRAYEAGLCRLSDADLSFLLAARAVAEAHL